MLPPSHSIPNSNPRQTVGPQSPPTRHIFNPQSPFPLPTHPSAATPLSAACTPWRGGAPWTQSVHPQRPRTPPHATHRPPRTPNPPRLVDEAAAAADGAQVNTGAVNPSPYEGLECVPSMKEGSLQEGMAPKQLRDRTWHGETRTTGGALSQTYTLARPTPLTHLAPPLQPVREAGVE